jgi:oligopeptide transport system ATP-binding protein
VSQSVEECPVLEVRNLHTHFVTRHGVVKAVNGASFTVMPGETTGLVGESGSGKTVTCLSVLRLLPPGGRIVEGEIKFRGRSLLDFSDREMGRLRGQSIGMIPQNSMAALDPVFTVGTQIAEPLVFHRQMSWERAMQESVELLRMVKIPAPEFRIKSYPHELSGGMRQRAASAAAIGGHPSLLIADEPTTALDVTTQRQYLDLLEELQSTTGMSLLFITHDISLVGVLCDTLAVFYGGSVVERGPRDQVLKRPNHPYTRALLKAIPVLGQRKERLSTIPGEPARAAALPPGCPFSPRCESVMGVCCEPPPPPPYQVEGGVSVRCWLFGQE